MTSYDNFCVELLDPFIKKIFDIKIKLSNNIVDDSEIKKLEYIINLYNDLMNDSVKQQSKIYNFDFLDSSDESDDEIEKKEFDIQVLNMIKRSKITYEYFKQNSMISYKINDDQMIENNCDTSDDDLNESEVDC
jgi:hypothetical protein